MSKSERDREPVGEHHHASEATSTSDAHANRAEADCTPFTTVAISGRLGVGVKCPSWNPPDPTLYVNGTFEVNGRADVGELGFLVHGKPSAEPSLRADQNNASQVNLDGALRARGVDVGVPAGAPVSQSVLTVQGTSGDARVLQSWRASDGAPLAEIDSAGRLGIGNPAPEAPLDVRGRALVGGNHALGSLAPTSTLTVRGTLSQKLSGVAEGLKHSPIIKGTDTKFQAELCARDCVGIAIQGKQVLFTVASIEGDLQFTAEEAAPDDFTGEPIYVDEPPVSIQSGAGKEVLSVDRTGTLSAAQFVGQGAVIKGMIVLWSGAVAEIPQGWALCDGTNGTPDLRDRFILGAGQTAPNTSGGPSTHAHGITIPDTTATASAVGDHTHGIPLGWYANNAGNFGGLVTVVDRATQPVDPSTQTQASGGHGHTVGIHHNPFSSDSYADEIRPKWYALCYIMKL